MKRAISIILSMLLSLAGFSQSTYTQNFTTTGSNSWICPNGVTSITVECYGAGGGGGGKNSRGAGGGGGGGYAKSVISVTPGTKYYYFIGAGGAAGAANSNGTDGGAGGASWFNASTSSPYTSSNSQPTGTSSGILAGGGSGGTGVNNSTGLGGLGANINYGSTTWNGGAGANGVNSSTNGGGGGGGGAGSTGSGGAGGTTVSRTAGAAGSGGGGAGGTGGLYVLSGSNAGGAGTAPGGGGGGCYYFSSTNVAGGAGGDGKIVISYTACLPLFQQDFSASTTTSDYISSSPTIEQFTSITASQTINTATSNKLRLDNSSGATRPYVSRTYDFATTPTNVIVKFDVTFSSFTSYSNATSYMYLGTLMADGTSPSSSLNTYVHSRLCFATQSANPTNQFAIRNVDPAVTASNSAFYSGKQTITWVVNNSGGTLTYLAPDGTSKTVGDDKEDIWVGTTQVWDDAGCWKGTLNITDFYLEVANGAGIIDIDNITINPIVSAPTSSAGSSIACGGFSANWTTSECSASLEVSTSSSFASLLSGYPVSVTGSPYSVTGLSAGTTYYYRLRTSTGSNSNAIASAYSSTQNITTTAASVGGTVASDQTINSGQNPADISVSGITGSVTKWQSSLDNLFTSPADIAVASTTLLGAQMGALTQTKYYRAVVANGTCPAANSSYVTITVAQPLPIELLSFTGRPTDSGCLLLWSTATEHNNDYFTILWSVDGYHWTSIGKADGAGNSVHKIDYSYLDESPAIGTNYYILKQTDYDGRFEDSEIISVFSDRGAAPVLVSCANLLGQEVPIEAKGVLVLKYRIGLKEIIERRTNF